MDSDGRDLKELIHLRSAIEKKLGWGQGAEWSGTDFARLSDLVADETGKRLSVSTLKRLWGRTSANVRASRTTLDILSVFVGEESWRAVKKAALSSGEDDTKPVKGPHFRRLFLSSVLALFLLIGLLSISFLHPLKPAVPAAAIDASRVSFSVEKVTTGIPNTVIFRYDLDGQSVDSLELQQSWDDTRREILDPGKHLITSTYHSPGYYLAKLIAGGTVLDSQHVYLPSDGLEIVEVRKEGQEIKYQPQVPWKWKQGKISYPPDVMEQDRSVHFMGYQLSNLLPSPVISRDTFTMEIELLMTESSNNNHCNPLSIFLTGAEDIYYFGLGHPGCAGDFQGFFGGKSISGKHHDLSSLGFLPGEWVNISITKSGKLLSLQVNDNTLTVSRAAPDVGKIGGVTLQSQNLIELRRLSIADSNKHIDLLGVEFR